MTPRRRFWHVAGAGTVFQAGSAAVDSATVMSALVFQLTGSALAVGAVPAILRFGWLLPQIFVGYLAGKGGSSMPYYVIGAFGRTGAMALLCLLLWLGGISGWQPGVIGALTLGLWAVYAGLSGIVGVPYNDIVARSVPSGQRSRLLSIRFLGGGLLALIVAILADQMIARFAFPLSYAAITGVAAVLMLISSLLFVMMGEPSAPPARRAAGRFGDYLKEGRVTFRDDPAFRRFVQAQWCGGAVLMAAPFYILAADRLGLTLEDVALLLGVQTLGALVLNPLWGWWGDRRGKKSLMRAIALARILPPLVILALIWLSPPPGISKLLLFLTFFGLGALANGLTIAVIGLLMEISPDDRRPAYSGYFNALTAPAFLLPLAGGALAGLVGLWLVFLLAALAATAQVFLLGRIGRR